MLNDNIVEQLIEVATFLPKIKKPTGRSGLYTQDELDLTIYLLGEGNTLTDVAILLNRNLGFLGKKLKMCFGDDYKNLFGLGLTTTATRLRQRNAKVGKQLTIQHRLNISNALAGRIPSAEHRANLSASQKGKQKIVRPLSAEQKALKREAAIARFKGKPLSADHRKKLSEAHKGYHLTEQTKQKIGEAHRGMKRSVTTCQNISNALKGKVVPEERRRKISTTLTGRTHSEEQNRAKSLRQLGRIQKNARAVITPEGRFLCIKSAAEHFGIKRTTASERAANNRKGWKYDV